MPSTYSSLKIELIATGEQSGTWGATTNTNLGTAIEEAITGSADVTFTNGNDTTITLVDSNVTQAARNLRLNLVGSSTGAQNLILGSGCQIEKLYLINNTLGHAITVKNTTGTGIVVAAGKKTAVYNDGTNVVNAIDYYDSLSIGTATISGGTINNTAIGGTTAAAGTFTQVNVTGQGDLRLEDTTGGEYVALQAPSVLASSYTLTLPVDDGTNGQALVTDGNGVLSWSTAASGDVYGPASATDNAIARFDGTTGKIIQNSVVTIADTTGNMAGVGTISSGAITSSSLTSGRVLYAGTLGLIQDSANMTFNGTTLSVTDITDASLTSGRVVFAGASGNLTDSTNLTWNGTTLAITGALTATADSSFTSTGALLISKGTTLQQPGSPATGMMRYNTTTNQFEGYSGASPAWKSIGGSALSNDTSTASDLYPVFAAATTGTAENLYTSNAKLLYKPSTGELQASELVASNGIVLNNQTMSASYTMPAGYSGMSSGPFTVASGVTFTIPSGSRHVVL